MKHYFLLILPVLSIIFNDRLCDPGNAAMLPYTGIRFSKQNSVSANGKLKSHILISACQHGRNVANIEDQITPKSVNINWNQTICVVLEQPVATGLYSKLLSQLSFRDTAKWFKLKQTVNYNHNYLQKTASNSFNSTNSPVKCFKIARTSAYHSRSLPIFKPNVLVGGLFECQAEILPRLQPSQIPQFYELKNAPCNATPVAPLYSDNLQFQRLSLALNHLKLQYNIPFLYTSDSVINRYTNWNKDWHKDIDVNEHYNNIQPGTRPDRAFTKALNSLNSLWDKDLEMVRKAVETVAGGHIKKKVFNQFYKGLNEVEKWCLLKLSKVKSVKGASLPEWENS